MNAALCGQDAQLCGEHQSSGSALGQLGRGHTAQDHTPVVAVAKV